LDFEKIRFYRFSRRIVLTASTIGVVHFAVSSFFTTELLAATVNQLSTPTHLTLIQALPVEPDVEFLAWSADESKIATAGQLDRVLQVWDWRDKKVLAKLKKPDLGGHSIWFAGSKIVTAPLSMEPSDALTLWDFQAAKMETVPMPFPALRRQAEKFVVDVMGKRLALLRTPQRAIIFDIANWQVLADVAGLKAAAIAMSPDGSEFATANYDGTISIFEVWGGNLRLQFRAWPENRQSIAWAPDGRAIASGIAGSTTRLNQNTGKYENSNHPALVRLFDPASGAVIAQTKADIGNFQIKFLAFDKTSSLLLSNQQNGVLNAWDTRDLSLVKTISTEGDADFFAFSPSGRYLAISQERRVLICDWP
jgi:WD40 repeat protein